MHPETLAVHAGSAPDPQTGAIAPPLHLSTTFEHGPDAGAHTGFMYQRYTDPTVQRLEQALCALDHGQAALHFGTGLAAGSTLLQALPPGSHVLLADDCYFAFRRIAETLFPQWGYRYDVVDMTDHAAVQAALRPDTRCLWLETPSNPLLKISDVVALAALAQRHGALCVVDATFATPLLLRPLELGADVVLHSTTKYFGGHSDVMGGALVFARDEALAARCLELRKLLGNSAAPFNSWLVQRGIKTLACRLDWQQRSAMHLAQWLEGQPQVEQVHYPGLASHPQHALARRQMRGFGAMLSFRVRGDRERALAVAGKLRLIHNATSLGAVESLVEHRQSVEGPHSTMAPNLLRLSVGLEHADDLVADLKQALA